MLNELIHYYVSKLVDNPEQVTVTESQSEGKVIIEIRVAAQDLAKVIGKEGRTFKALRALSAVIDPSVKRDLVVDSAS